MATGRRSRVDRSGRFVFDAVTGREDAPRGWEDFVGGDRREIAEIDAWWTLSGARLPTEAFGATFAEVARSVRARVAERAVSVAMAREVAAGLDPASPEWSKRREAVYAEIAQRVEGLGVEALARQSLSRAMVSDSPSSPTTEAVLRALTVDGARRGIADARADVARALGRSTVSVTTEWSPQPTPEYARPSREVPAVEVERFRGSFWRAWETDPRGLQDLGPMLLRGGVTGGPMPERLDRVVASVELGRSTADVARAAYHDLQRRLRDFGVPDRIEVFRGISKRAGDALLDEVRGAGYGSLPVRGLTSWTIEPTSAQDFSDGRAVRVTIPRSSIFQLDRPTIARLTGRDRREVEAAFPDLSDGRSEQEVVVIQPPSGRFLVESASLLQLTRRGFETAQSVDQSGVAWAPKPAWFDAATRIAARNLYGADALEGRTLSTRLRTIAAENAQRYAEEINDALRRGLGAVALGTQLARAKAPDVVLPEYVAEMRAGVLAGMPRKRLRALGERYLAQLESYGATADNLSIKKASQRFVRQAMRATRADVDAITDRWIERRALYQARVIARTENARARTRAFIESQRDREETIGYRWNLSPSHPEPDVCDLYAGQDLDGLGEGGYAESGLPPMPAHPNCLCYLTTIRSLAGITDRRGDDLEAFEREVGGPTRSGPARVTAADVLRRATPEVRSTILGPTRERIFRKVPEAVVSPRGTLYSVSEARLNAATIAGVRAEAFPPSEDLYVESAKGLLARETGGLVRAGLGRLLAENGAGIPPEIRTERSRLSDALIEGRLAQIPDTQSVGGVSAVELKQRVRELQGFERRLDPADRVDRQVIAFVRYAASSSEIRGVSRDRRSAFERDLARAFQRDASEAFRVVGADAAGWWLARRSGVKPRHLEAALLADATPLQAQILRAARELPPPRVVRAGDVQAETAARSRDFERTQRGIEALSDAFGMVRGRSLPLVSEGMEPTRDHASIARRLGVDPRSLTSGSEAGTVVELHSFLAGFAGGATDETGRIQLPADAGARARDLLYRLAASGSVVDARAMVRERLMTSLHVMIHEAGHRASPRSPTTATIVRTDERPPGLVGAQTIVRDVGMLRIEEVSAEVGARFRLRRIFEAFSPETDPAFELPEVSGSTITVRADRPYDGAVGSFVGTVIRATRATPEQVSRALEAWTDEIHGESVGESRTMQLVDRFADALERAGATVDRGELRAAFFEEWTDGQRQTDPMRAEAPRGFGFMRRSE